VTARHIILSINTTSKSTLETVRTLKTLHQSFIIALLFQSNILKHSCYMYMTPSTTTQAVAWEVFSLA